jgi:hypothetical protein
MSWILSPWFLAQILAAAAHSRALKSSCLVSVRYTLGLGLEKSFWILGIILLSVPPSLENKNPAFGSVLDSLPFYRRPFSFLCIFPHAILHILLFMKIFLPYRCMI